MNAEQHIILELLEGSKAIDWVAERIRYNVEGELELPTKDQFWKQLVLALLSSQQRSTKGSEIDLFGQKEPFPLALSTYQVQTNDGVRDLLKSFRYGKRVTDYLRTNYSRLFGPKNVWAMIEPLLQELLVQRNSPPHVSHKDLERDVAHRLADQLKGIGPKQSRNLLQELGLTRYEIPLDSRVAGWLGKNLDWYISRDSLSNAEYYEFWLDRLQSACEAARVLPTAFDAAAFDKGSAAKSPTNRIGYVNKNGQVVVRNTRQCGTDNNQCVYQLGCSHCGHVYEADGSDIYRANCPKSSCSLLT